jgi:hypothetical protein
MLWNPVQENLPVTRLELAQARNSDLVYGHAIMAALRDHAPWCIHLVFNLE